MTLFVDTLDAVMATRGVLEALRPPELVADSSTDRSVPALTP
ncbi:MAG: hypothetical protein ACE141_19030 [Bryobacteraceae bacterium]